MAISPQEVPSRQCFWLLTLICLQFKGNYFILPIPQQYTESFCCSIENQVDNLVNKCFKIKQEELSIFNKAQIRLPIKFEGIGIHQLIDVRWSEFIGGMMEGVIPLLDKNNDGNTIKVELESGHIKYWIRRNALDSNDGPWHTLEQQESALGLGMKITHTNISGQFNQAAAPDTDKNWIKTYYMVTPHLQA